MTPTQNQRKPTLTTQQARWWAAVHRDYDDYLTTALGATVPAYHTSAERLHILRCAFSHTWKGKLSETDVLPLMRMGLLRRSPWWDRAGYSPGRRLGDNFDVILTGYAIVTFWPSRYAMRGRDLVDLTQDQDTYDSCN